MTDIRKYFKKVPSSSTESKSKKSKNDDRAEVVVPKRQMIVEIPPLKKQKTKELDPEEKRRRSESYKSFVNRGGPDAPGSKEIPEGKPNCLKNITFVISGTTFVFFFANENRFDSQAFWSHWNEMNVNN